MHYFKMWVVIVYCLLMVTACANHKDEAYFLRHPEQLLNDYKRCRELNPKTMSIQELQVCSNVSKVMPTFRAYLAELLNTPGVYAKNIMQAESQLVALQNLYQKTNQQNQLQIDSIKRAMELERLQIDARFALIRFISKISH